MSPKSEKKYLTAEEVCSILSRCRETGVSKLKFGDLLVAFGPSVDVAPKKEVELENSPPTETDISETQKNEAERSLVKDELALRDEQLAELLLADPSGAEKMLIDGALEESEDGPEDRE